MAVADNLYTMPSEDSVVDLAQGWQLAEFNVFGDGNGAQAEFNTGSEIVVRTSVDYGSPLAPSCEATGLTADDHASALPCGSASTNRTLCPTRAQTAARFMAMVVLSAPPF